MAALMMHIIIIRVIKSRKWDGQDTEHTLERW